jgi:serine protease Do
MLCGRGLITLLIVLIGLSAHSCKSDSIRVVQSSAGQASTAAEAPASIQTERTQLSETIELTGLQAKFEAVAHRVAPMVVAISASSARVDSEEALRSDDLNAEKLAKLLSRSSRTVGTGFIIDSEGYILTNEHVVGDAEQLWVTTDDRRVFPALVIGSDPRVDLAVLKIPAMDMPAVNFADGRRVRRGHWTLALGNPYGLAGPGEMSLSVGVVSATNRSLPRLSSKENRLYSNLIQTTAEINPGNSGGPLFDIDGNVIGVNTAVILPQKQTNGIGFAMPVTPRMLSIVNDLKQGREVVHGYLGVMVSTPTQRERRAAGLDRQLGARVDNIERSTPASESELRTGDIIISINEEPVDDADHFVRLIATAPVDLSTRLDIIRDGREVAVDVRLRRRQLSSVSVTRENQRLRWRGMLLGPIPSNWESPDPARPESGLMVIGIDPGSPFAIQGITAGTVIQAVAGMPVRSMADLQRIINDYALDHWELHVAGPADVIVSAQH